MICPNCGKEVEETNYCIMCGFNLKEYNKLYPIVRERIEEFVVNDEVIQRVLNDYFGDDEGSIILS